MGSFDPTVELYAMLVDTTTRAPGTNHSALTTGQVVYRVMAPVIGTVVILLNLAVVVSSGLILRRNMHPRTTYMFLGNIALCDLVTGVSVVFGSTFPKEWRRHRFCGIQLGLIVASTLTSAWSVGLIALDRFFYIIHGIKYTQWVYGSRVRLLVFSTWVLTILVGFVPAMWWEATPEGKCWLVLLAPKPLLLALVVLGWIPLLLNATFYLIILYYALRKAIHFREAAEKGSVTVNNLRISRGGGPKSIEEVTKSEAASKWKAIKVVTFTTGAYMSTWFPYTVACFLHFICSDPVTCNTIANLIAVPFAILLLVNSFMNPIIYAWWHEPFRRNVAAMVRKGRQNNRKNNLQTISEEGGKRTTDAHDSTHV